jgi:hypothetical protein
MSHAVAREAPKGDPLTDLIYLLWGAIVSWMQWLDLAALNEGIGIGVGALTIVLLLYRIALAHLELEEETEADA